jgi:hypothetical protein
VRAQQIKPLNEPNAHSWRMPIVLQDKSDCDTRIAVSAISQVTDNPRFTRNPWAQGQERSISRLLGGIGGNFSDTPQSIGGSFQRPSEGGNRDSGNSRPKLRMSNGGHNFQERDIEYIVWLALLGCAALAGFTYVYIDGMKYKNSNDEKCTNKKTKNKC